jgi:hypothetical protein
MADVAEGRPINPLLMLGLLMAPLLFVWLLFLPGYARSTRTAALVYTFFPAALVSIALALQWLAGA